MDILSTFAKATKRLQSHELMAMADVLGFTLFGVYPDGSINLWSCYAEQIYGYTSEEAIGSSITRLSPLDRRMEFNLVFNSFQSGESAFYYGTKKSRRNGEVFDAECMALPLRNADLTLKGLIFLERDRSDQTNALRNLSSSQVISDERKVVLETANQVAIDILTSRTGLEALSHIAEAAGSLSGAQYAALGVARKDGKGLQSFITHGLSPEEERVIGQPPVGKGILGLLLRSDSPLRIDCLSHHPDSAGFPPRHPPMESFLGVPIKRGDSIVGSLYLTNKLGGGSFTDEDEKAVEALGHYAAIAIHNLQQLERQRALVSGLIDAQEEERQAVAYELHDGLTQYIMAAHAHLQSYQRALQSENEERAGKELQLGLSYLKEAALESRRLISGLRSLALDDLGLAGALEQMVNEEKSRADWTNVDFLHNIAGQRFDKPLETAVYRVAQEALTNVRKHAGADSVRISLLYKENQSKPEAELALEIIDKGIGFIPEEKEGDFAHVGLQSMMARVRLFSGEYSLISSPGKGTRIRARFLTPILQHLIHEVNSDDQEPA